MVPGPGPGTWATIMMTLAAAASLAAAVSVVCSPAGPSTLGTKLYKKVFASLQSNISRVAVCSTPAGWAAAG